MSALPPDAGSTGGLPGDADNGGKRDPATPHFHLTGEITSRQFDARSFVTQIGASAKLGKEHALAGSVVRIGKQWSVVKSNGPDSLLVWGKITDEASTVEILESYLPPDDKPNIPPKDRRVTSQVRPSVVSAD